MGWEADVGIDRRRAYKLAMAAADNLPPKSLGLGADGDEIAAIEEVERRFGVQLDTVDAAQWKTAGDVFAALLRALPAHRAEADDTWTIFTDAMCIETGVDPRKVTPETLLLGQRYINSWELVAIAMAFMSMALGIVSHL